MLACVVIIVLLQARVVVGGYYMDSDDWFVVSMGHWADVLGLHDALMRFWTEEPTWRPLLTLVSLLEWTLFGAESAGRYVVNLGLHVLAALLVFWWVRLRRPAIAGLASLLYLAHPLHAEALAWFHSGFEGILVSVFGLLVLVAQGAPERRAHGLRRGAPRVALMLFFLQLGLWSRESIAAIVPVVALIAFIEGEHVGRWRRVLHDALPLAGLVLVNVIWRFVMLELEPDRRALGTFHTIESPLTALAAVALQPWLPVHPGLPSRELFWALTGLVSVLLLGILGKSRDGRIALLAFGMMVLPFLPMFHEAGRFFEAAGGGHEQRWYFFHLALAPLCVGAAYGFGAAGVVQSRAPSWVSRVLVAFTLVVFVATQLANAAWWREESDVARSMAATLRDAVARKPSLDLGIVSSEGSDAVELADQVLLNFANLDPEGRRSGRRYFRFKACGGEVSKDVVESLPLRSGGPSPIPRWRPWRERGPGPHTLWFSVDEERRTLIPTSAPRAHIQIFTEGVQRSAPAPASPASAGADAGLSVVSGQRSARQGEGSAARCETCSPAGRPKLTADR